MTTQKPIYADFLTHDGPMPKDGIIRDIVRESQNAAGLCKVHADNVRAAKLLGLIKF